MNAQVVPGVFCPKCGGFLPLFTLHDRPTWYQCRRCGKIYPGEDEASRCCEVHPRKEE